MPIETLTPAVILVVDHEPVVSRLASRYLTHLGYRVLEASSGRDALASVHRRSPPIDVVLSNIVMPEMDGVELAAAVLAECPGPTVLLMTGQLPDGVEHIRIGWCIVRVVRKPLDFDELTELLQVTLEGYPSDPALESGQPAGH